MGVAFRVLEGALAALAPREREEVYEWAERCLVLSADVTAEAGPLRLRGYQKGEWSPLWAWLRYNDIDLIWATQTSKTLMMQVTVGYSAAHDQAPGMLVFPAQDICATRSSKHIKPFLKDNLAEYLTGKAHDMSTFKYTLKSGQTFLFGWSGSSAKIASEPIANLWLDEKAKFKGGTPTEPDAEKNAKERTKSFRPFHRHWGSTTPTRAKEPGWRSWEGSTRCKFEVCCKGCGHWQALYFGEVDRRVLEPEETGKWPGGVKWDRDEALSKEERCRSAWYQCEACDCRWNDYDVNRAVECGRWVARDPHAKRYAAHLNSIYAPSIKLADMVEKWFESYKDPEARKLFMNSWLAVPYVEEGQRPEESFLRSKVLVGHTRMSVPAQACAIFLTADVHDANIRYRVRAWDAHGESWGIEEGELLPALNSLDPVLQRRYRATDGSVRGIDRALIDRNWRTEEVYQWCLQHYGVAYPISGRNLVRGKLLQFEKAYVLADPTASPPRMLGGELEVVVIDDDRSKDNLFLKIRSPKDLPGAWHLEEGIGDEYLHQMRGEQKVEDLKKGLSKWVLLHDNHALDCEKYQLIAWEVFQVANMVPPADAANEADGGVEINPFTGKPVGSY